MCNKTINHAAAANAANAELFALVSRGAAAAVLDVKLALVPSAEKSPTTMAVAANDVQEERERETKSEV